MLQPDHNQVQFSSTLWSSPIAGLGIDIGLEMNGILPTQSACICLSVCCVTYYLPFRDLSLLHVQYVWKFRKPEHQSFDFEDHGNGDDVGIQIQARHASLE